MSVEQLKAFVDKVKADTELQEKLKAAASPEAVVGAAGGSKQICEFRAQVARTATYIRRLPINRKPH